MAILGLYSKKKSTLTPTGNQKTYTEQVFNTQKTRPNSVLAKSLGKTVLDLPGNVNTYLAQILERGRNKTL